MRLTKRSDGVSSIRRAGLSFALRSSAPNIAGGTDARAKQDAFVIEAARIGKTVASFQSDHELPRAPQAAGDFVPYQAKSRFDGTRGSD